MFLVEPGEVSRVRVYREHDGTRKWTTHGFLPTDECTEELVAQLFGGGKWVCQKLLVDQVTGKSRIASTKMFTVPGPYKPPTGPLPGLDPAQPTTQPGAPGSPSIVSLAPHGVNVKEYLDNVLLLRAMEKPTAIDWGPILVAALPVIGKFLEPRGPTTDPMIAQQFAELRTALTDLKKQPGPAAAGINDALDAMQGLLGLKDAITEARGGQSKPEGEDTGMWGALSKLADAVMSGRGAAQPGTEVQALPPGAPANDPTAPTMPPWQALVLEHQARLLDAAQRGMEPDFVAEMTARFVPEHQRGILTELIVQPNVRDLMVQVVPGLQHYPTWLDAFLKELHGQLLGTDETEVEVTE